MSAELYDGEESRSEWLQVANGRDFALTAAIRWSLPIGTPMRPTGWVPRPGMSAHREIWTAPADGQLLRFWHTLDGIDPALFEALWADVGPTARRMARSQMREAADVDDFLQSVWLRVVERRAQFQGRGPLGTWVITICRNSLADRQKGSASNPHVEIGGGALEECAALSPDPLASVARAHAREELYQRAEQTVAGLPDGQREVVVNRILKGWPYRAIAEQRGTTEGSARASFRDGVAALRKQFAANPRFSELVEAIAEDYTDWMT